MGILIAVGDSVTGWPIQVPHACGHQSTMWASPNATQAAVAFEVRSRARHVCPECHIERSRQRGVLS